MTGVQTCALPIFMPTSTEQVAAVVRVANELGIPVVPRDGGTGLTDGAVPHRRGIVVDVKKMNQIHELDLAKDRKSTRLNSSHANISYAVFCLKKKKNL